MTRNITEIVREKIAREIRIQDTERALMRARYAELIRDALCSIERFEARRTFGREHVIPEAAFSKSEIAWFRKAVQP